MTASLAGVYNFQAFKSTGDLAASYRLYTYSPGTTTHKAAYTEQTGVTTHTYTADGLGGQYIAVNARGELPSPLFLSSGGYDLCLKTDAGVTVWTRRAYATDEATTTLQTDLADVASASKGAGLVGYDVDLAYANATVGDALHKHGRVLQGADPTGVADSTSALRALFDLCIPNGYVAVLPSGTYKVTGPITANGTLGASANQTGNLFIHCAGDVTINVDAASTHFQRLITLYSNAANSSSITGGRLTLNLNNKSACGIYLRHLGTAAGHVQWGPVEVNDVFDVLTTGNTVMETAGLQISGQYLYAELDGPYVDGVDRTAVTGGVCKGISISETVGNVVLNSPTVKNVLCTPAAPKADADGIAVFAAQRIAGAGNVYKERPGKLEINGPHVEDCEGRGIKTQMSRSVIRQPFFKRQMVVSFATGEIDHQIGGHHVVENPTYYYTKNGGADPVPAGWIPMGIQIRCEDMPNHFEVRGGALMSESQFNYYSFLTYGNTTDDPTSYSADPKNSTVIFDGLHVQGIGALAGGVVFLRTFCELHMGRLQNNTNSHNIRLQNIRANLAATSLLAYTSAAAADADNLSVSYYNNENTGASTGVDLFDRLSGSTPTSFAGRWIYEGNVGFIDDRYVSISGTGPTAPNTGFGKVANGGATNMSTMVPTTNLAHQVVTLRFDNANTTLIHGTGANAISLKGAANTNPAAGTYVTLEFDNTDVGYWREATRSY